MSVSVSWGRTDIISANWDKVVEYLNIANDEGGIILLHNYKNTFSLEVDVGQGLYLPIFEPYFDNKVELRFYHTPEKEMRRVTFDGESEYDALLTEDFDLILRLAKEFYDTGDVKAMVPEDELPPAIDD